MHSISVVLGAVSLLLFASSVLSCKKHDGTLYCMGNCTLAFQPGAPTMDTISELVLSLACRPSAKLAFAILPGLLAIRCPSGDVCNLADLTSSVPLCPCLGAEDDDSSASGTEAPEEPSTPPGSSLLSIVTSGGPKNLKQQKYSTMLQSTTPATVQYITESMAPAEPTVLPAASTLEWLWVALWDGPVSTHQAILMVIISSLTYLVYGLARVGACWLYRQQQRWRRSCRRQLRRLRPGPVAGPVLPRGSPVLPPTSQPAATTVPTTSMSAVPTSATFVVGPPAMQPGQPTWTSVPSGGFPPAVPVSTVTWLRDHSDETEETGGSGQPPLPPPPSPPLAPSAPTAVTGYFLKPQVSSFFLGTVPQQAAEFQPPGSSVPSEQQQDRRSQTPASSRAQTPASASSRAQTPASASSSSTPASIAAGNQQAELNQQNGQVFVKPWAAACGLPPIPSPVPDSGVGSQDTCSFNPNWFQEGRLKLHGASSPVVRMMGSYVCLPTPTATHGTISAIRSADAGGTPWTLQHGATAMSISNGTPMGRHANYNQENRLPMER